MDLSGDLILIFLGVGLVAGFIAGFVGVGGGIIMVPVLLEVFRRWGLPADAVVQAAMGTSLSVAVFTVFSSVVRHARQKRIMWSLLPWLIPGSVGGGWVFARVATRLPGLWLQLTLAGLMAFAAIRLLTDRSPDVKPAQHVRPVTTLLVGLLVGAVAGLSGLAGGIVLVPALALLLSVHAGWLAGTSSATILFSAMAAAISYLTATPPAPLGDGFVGYVCWPLTLSLAASGILGAQFGAWTNRRTGSTLFKRLFGALMLIVVVRLLLNL